MLVVVTERVECSLMDLIARFDHIPAGYRPRPEQMGGLLDPARSVSEEALALALLRLKYCRRI